MIISIPTTALRRTARVLRETAGEYRRHARALSGVRAPGRASPAASVDDEARQLTRLAADLDRLAFDLDRRASLANRPTGYRPALAPAFMSASFTRRPLAANASKGKGEVIKVVAGAVFKVAKGVMKFADGSFTLETLKIAQQKRMPNAAVNHRHVVKVKCATNNSVDPANFSYLVDHWSHGRQIYNLTVQPHDTPSMANRYETARCSLSAVFLGKSRIVVTLNAEVMRDPAWDEKKYSRDSAKLLVTTGDAAVYKKFVNSSDEVKWSVSVRQA